MKKYVNYSVRKAIRVRSLITVEQLDVSPTFSYPEEQHNFYEFAYLDSGKIRCRFEEETIPLTQGDFLLIPPKTRHYYEACPGLSASILVICFAASGDPLSLLDHCLSLDSEAKKIVSDILREAKNAFVFPFQKKIQPRSDFVFGAQQLVESHIERLLILLIRRELKDCDRVRFVMNSLDLENRLAGDITALLKEHLYDHISLQEISSRTFYSKTFLNTVFKKNTGFSIMQYFNMLKIEEAKKMIRENRPIGFVALCLHYESATYFTKVFKRFTGMTPTDYRKTVL